MLNNHIRFAATALLAAFLVTGCVSAGNVAMKEQNQQTIEQTIIKGKTNSKRFLVDLVLLMASLLLTVVMKFGHTATLAPNRWQEILSLIISFLWVKIYRPKNLSFYLTAKA